MIPRSRAKPLFDVALRLAATFILAGCGGNGQPEESPGPDAPGPYGTGHALAGLICEETMVTPGRPVTLGITFDIEPEWYLYWNGQNDTGYPIQVHPEFPEGFTAGEIQWPAPERHVSPGNILDHIYPGRVTLLMPVRVPEDAEARESVTFTCRLEWLACREVCVPGASIVSLTLPIIGDRGNELDTVHRKAAGKAVSEQTRARFAETRPRLPVPIESAPQAVSRRWEGSTLILEAAGAERLTFYPHSDCAPLESVLRDGVASGGLLTLNLAEETQEDLAVTGVLEIDPGSSAPSRFYTIRIPLADAE